MKGQPRRVAVTGLGIVCSIGRNQSEFWASLLEGRSGIREVDLFDPSGCLGSLAAQVPDEHRSETGSSPTKRRDSRTDLFCLQAAGEAAAQAGLKKEASVAEFGVSLGSSTAGMLEAERYCEDGLDKGFDRVSPSRVLRLPNSTPADAVARHFGARGPRVSNMTACASSAVSIGLAAELIRSGDAPGMITGGGDGLCLMTYSGFNALRLQDPRPCRPFDSSRQGLSLGEGAGILFLENWDLAIARGVDPMAEFVGYGTSCDAHHMTAPHPEGEGAALAMSEALRHSDLSATDIGHINAHGTGTPANDASEARAIMSLFEHTPVTATKSNIGHLLGGAGAVEAVALVLSLIHQIIPPTLRINQLDDGVILDVVTGKPRRSEFEYGLSNSFGFGGTNCALIFRRPS